MVEFFNQHFDPASSERARLSIHLHAQGKAEGVEKRQEEAQKKADEEAPAGDIPSAISTAVEITDVRVFKANLPASSGAQPVKEVSEYEYEDTETK
jgi:insulysin